MAETLKGLAKALTLGVLLACLLFVPFSTQPVSADGGSTGVPGTPPADSTDDAVIKGDEEVQTSSSDDLLIDALKLTTAITLMSY